MISFVERTRAWIRHNQITILTALIYLTFGILAYAVPPYYTWFEWHRNLVALGVLTVGLAAFPIGLLALVPGFSLAIHTAVAIIYFTLTGILTGKVIERLWRKCLAGKIGLGVAFIINLLVGLFALAWGDVLVTENASLGCQNFINAEQGLRIVTFEQDRGLPGAYHFYLFTADGGTTWEQLFVDSSDEISVGDCRTIQSLNRDFIWVWSGYRVHTTHDGGRQWDRWEWECCTYGAVRQVSFQDENTGTITVYPWRSSISELSTADGGKSWQPAD